MDISVLIDLLGTMYLTMGYLIVFIGNFIETSPLGWVVPGGILVALGGFYAYNTSLSLIGIVIFSTLGMVSTLYIAYYLGHKTGLKLAKRFNQEWIAKRAETLLEKHGAIILTTSLIANLSRFWISYVAGTKRYNFKLFTLYAVIASLTWNTLLVFVGYLAGAERQQLESYIRSLGIVAWILVFIAIGIIYWKIDVEFRKDKPTK